MIRVGLTGGIACGKSYVRARLAAAGFRTLDLDRVAHAVMAPGGPAYAEVVAAFGRGIVGSAGEIDRRLLGQLVFADPAARRRLEALVHPRVREEEARWSGASAAEGAEAAVTDAALLVETGQHLRFDRLLVVHCPEAEQVRRLRERDGLDETAARARVAAQMPIDEKRTFGHLQVDTSGTFTATDAAVDAVAAELRLLRAAPPLRPPLPRALAALGTARGPRGLDAGRVAADIAAAGFLDLKRLAALLDPPPPPDVPWYRAADAAAAAPAWSLAGAVAVWACARGGDAPFVAAAAASLARLTHRDAASLAGACLVALRLHEALLPAVADGEDLEALAARWGGGSAPPAAARAASEAVPGRPAEDPADPATTQALRVLGYG
ncbi:MAG: dephospho-CoA kinase [Vicinamibacteria bacterium]